MSYVRPMWRVLILLPLLGCDGESAGKDGESACEPGGDPTLRIGTGTVSFEDVPDEGFELIHGSQGGFHIEIALEATHLAAEGQVGGTMTGTIDGEVMAQATPWLAFRCDADTRLISSGSILVYDATPEELHGQTTTVEVEVNDEAGTLVDATVTADIYDPALD